MLDEVSKSFRDGEAERVILQDVSLAVASGSMICIVGPSGCGKTTLLNVLCGFSKPDSGVVSLQGMSMNFSRPSDVSRLRLRHIGLVPQGGGLLSSESVASNVIMPLRLAGRGSRSDNRRRVLDVLEEVDLDCPPSRRVSTLSGGEKQRVALARALVLEPAILVADEPTSALDRQASARMSDLLARVANRGVAVVIATHDPQVSARSDQIWELASGVLVRTSAQRCV